MEEVEGGTWKAKIRTRLAEAKARIGEDASIDLERALADLAAESTDDLTTLYVRAELLTRLGRRTESGEAWQCVLAALDDVAPDDLPDALMLRHTAEPAERAYARTAPNAVEARRAILSWRAMDALGDLSLSRADRKAAVAHWQSAAAVCPSLAAWSEPKLGRLLVQQGRVEDGLASLRAALVARPLEPSIWRALADMLFQARRLAECSDLCEELLERVRLTPRLAPEGFWLRQRATECRVHFQQTRSTTGGFAEVWV